MKWPKKISDVVPITVTVLFYFVTVTFANLSGGWSAALLAGVLQVAWTLPMSIFVFKSCSYFAQNFQIRSLAYSLAIFFPTAISTVGTIIWHIMFGSPEPFLSAIPTLVSTPLACGLWTMQKRREKFLKK